VRLLAKFKREKLHRCGDSTAQIWSRLQTWYQTPTGQRLQELERQQLEQVLPDLFGYHLVQIGYVGQADLTAASRISHRVLMSADDRTLPEHAIQFCGESSRLPIATDSVDVVVLPHVLEFSPYPHEVLREVDRILVPEGHVIILTFNPFSFWNGWRWTYSWGRKIPWCGKFLSATRLRDWLALLGFDMVQQQGYGFMTPGNTLSLEDRLERIGQRFLSFAGGSLLLVAKKRVTTLTPIRPGWRQRHKARWVAGGLVEPCTSHKNQRKVS